MPRLSRAQKEVKEANRAAAHAKRAADLQTGVGSSASSKAPPTPSASSLSTNQPIAPGRGKKRKASLSASTRAAAEADEDDDSMHAMSVDADDIAANADGPGGRHEEEDRRSPSVTIARPKLQRKEASSSAVPASPPALDMDSDMSTSGDSDLEGEASAMGGADASRAQISLVDEHADGDEDEETGAGGAGESAMADDASPEVKCMWEDCGQVFSTLAPFINHLHDEHVGTHKARYACEWTGCPRKGKGQTSRFALLSHLRSHTGEKPFTCPRPECDKSFTRSDALAKHMRVQHNITPVTTRGKNAAHQLALAGGGRAGRMRNSMVDGEDDDWNFASGGGSGAAGGKDGGGDLVGDELLELAEGEANGSLVDIEQSLLMHDSKSPFFTYDNLFGAGARALAHVGMGTGKKGDPIPSYGLGPIPDEELGIVRDHAYGAGLSADGEARDEEAIRREETEIARVLEAGRRSWVVRERERGELRDEVNASALAANKHAQVDYFSDDEADADMDTSTASKAPKRQARRSSMRTTQKQAQSISDVTNLKRLYLIEKAKYRWIRRENERMRLLLADLRQTEQREMTEKRILLERTLEAELGRDVAAIFSPPGSPIAS